ncbi:methionine--tRNA ligase, cytoplasmic isoform X2 [Leptidea sinapis]|uniref:methionine--tRNA ligase, cytoplasmic isoform X2 n=1 Tax=Leptidea sinapis TaxID=189913 RepID=UPI0021314548|nr:methionine--tRNA ligase, cytoplasmic isoform X2 [Leptidea sinapis]
MKIFTNDNNTATLKLLVAANLADKKIELKKASFEDNFAAPKSLPILQVDELTFFSSNAATQYLFPVVGLSETRQCLQIQEWEATRLQPTIANVLSSKTVPVDLKQVLQTLLQTIDSMLAKHKYILGDKLSAADISIWSTLYPLNYNEELRNSYMSEYLNIKRWTGELNNAKAFTEALKQWPGSQNGPFAQLSALGIPQISSIPSPVGTPDETQAVVTQDEIESAKQNWINGVENLQKPLKQEKVVLPIKGQKNILITSALPYVNNIPHLGNIIGCVLSADIFARYCRMCDYNTLYVCGTDEYGTATETKALEEGLTPRQICDKYYEIHNSVYRWFNIGFDYFGRTSTPEQTQIVQELFMKLHDNGFISPQSVEQLFCENCQRFLADRFVEGTCPFPTCRYDNARGDQCDQCGKLINAIELLEPRCKVCSHRPTVRPSEQLFIELDQLEGSVRTWLQGVEAGWSGGARAVSRAWLRDRLRPRAVTRDLHWGVPVPLEKYTKKVFYVWFDAPFGYVSITQCATKNYEKWWKPDKEVDVKLYQFMAKDNVPFHAIMFPASAIGINENIKLVDHIFATEYLNYEDSKFSKSRGVGVFGTDAQETGIPSDVWRFYLASIRPETSDSSFNWTELCTRNNSELLNNLGNFCHRSLSFCANTFKGKLPEATLTHNDYELISLVNREVVAYVQHMEKGRLREALRHVLSVSRLGNQHMQTEQPWVLLKGSDGDKIRGATAISLCCQLAALLCALISPYMPDTSRKLKEQLNLKQDLRINPINPSLIQYIPAGHVIGKPEPLFAKIEPELADKMRAKFAGTQSEREIRNANDSKTKSPGVAEIEKAIAEQGGKVRQLKASTKDKAVWQPEVNKLLELKKQLAGAQAQTGSAVKPPTANNVKQETRNADVIEDLTKAIAEQGEKVRKLKASTKDKSVWQPEVDKLLDLKKIMATAQLATPAPSDSVASLEKAVAEQGEKVRQLKASTKDKSVWQPEVNVLLDLKKRLAQAQANK